MATEDLIGWIEIALVPAGGLLTWVWTVERRMSNRITYGELDNKFEDMKKERMQLHKENSSSLNRIENKLEDFSVHADRLRRAEKDIDDLREWKHDKADPYIGVMDRLNDRVERLEKS